MLKVWAVVYVMSKAVMVFGPLPITVDDCRAQAAQRLASLSPDDLRLKAAGKHKQDISVRCVEATTKPKTRGS